MRRICFCFYIFWLASLAYPVSGWALSPDEVLVIANGQVAESEPLARYYMAQRKIPATHLLMLQVTAEESIAREDYDCQVVHPVRAFLQKNRHHNIRCLVTIYGMPLKIQPPALTPHEHQAVAELRQREKALDGQLKQLDYTAAEEERKTLQQTLAQVRDRLKALNRDDQRAALDSELALVKVADYPLAGWIPSPFFMPFKDRALPIEAEQVLLVSRLDGPTPEIVRRVIDDSLAVEKKGLSGTAYFDARWPAPDSGKLLKDYRLYDNSIHLAAEAVRKTARMQVVLDDHEALFQPGQGAKAALYCGWYSLAQYVDAFDWVPGAVGYHIASAECSTLKRPDSQVWCKRMLEQGIAATIGPTSEPYVQAYTVPEIFFPLLIEGRLSLAECYARATPFLSWQMVLIGDPLYRPFGR
jgi:uncharacterized protein (TIGR03790 family)